MQTIIKFFKSIFLIDLLKGLWITLKYTPQPAFTFQYPAERRPTAPRFRGVLRLQTEPGTGAQTCIVCDQCAKACPDDLIALGGHREPGQKIKVLDYFDFNLSRCSFCGSVRGSLSDQADQGADHERGLRARQLQPRNADSARRPDVRRRRRSSSTRTSSGGGFMAGGIRAAAVGAVAGGGVVPSSTPRRLLSRSRPKSSFSSATNSSPRAVISDALDAFQRALAVAGPDDLRAARAGLIQSALRVAEFDLAAYRSRKTRRRVAEVAGGAGAVRRRAVGLGSLRRSRSALPRRARGGARSRARPPRHGARAGGAQPADEAMDEAQTALRLAPRDLEIHHTVGAIYERMHRYEEAAGAFSNYVNLLPNKDHSEKADWSRSEIKFLRSFGQRVPFEMDPGPEDQLYTIDFRLVNDKVVVRAKVNDGSFQDFVVDTGAENTVHFAADRAAPRDHADHLHAQRRRRRRRAARSAAGAHQHARARTAEAAQRAVPDQGSAAARSAGEGSGEPVAARARLLDDHRLQDEEDHLRQAPARRSRRTSSCRCACIGWRPSAARSTARIRPTSSSIPAAR